MRRLFLCAGLAVAVSGCGGECKEVSGNACVWAGTGELGDNGDKKHRLETRLYWPIDVELAPDGTPWVLDWNNHKIRKVVNDEFVTVVGDFLGDGPPDQSDLTPAGADGLTVRLNHPTDIQFLPDGTFEFAAWHNHKLRKVTTDGRVTVTCGRGGGFGGDGMLAGATTLFNQPKAIVRAADGTTYVLDQRNFRIRKIAPDGMVSTVVGTGTAGFAGDNGPPLMAQLKFEAGGNPEPSGALALDSAGNLYISDGLNHRIRKVDFTANVITTIAGTGEAGFSGDGAAATSAQINNVRDLELGPDGRLYLADSENHRIRAIDLSSGIIETVVGIGTNGEKGDGLPAKEVELDRPFGIAFDKDGNLFVSDTFNSRILKVKR
jgi:hypothetical protein